MTEKLQALEQLVLEQLDAKHIEESTSHWNSPLLLFKKNLKKWRMVTDLRTINKGYIAKGLSTVWNSSAFSIA